MKRARDSASLACHHRPMTPGRFFQRSLPVVLLTVMVVIGLGIEAVLHPPLRPWTELPLIVLLGLYFWRLYSRHVGRDG